jgi:hypothetical protein
VALQSRWLMLCRLGWHSPEPGPAWNNGYYFSRCSRCRRDLVRTTYSGWEVPRGYRIVWRANQPGNEGLSPLNASSPAMPVHERPSPTAAPPAVAPPAPEPARQRAPQRAPQRRPTGIPDFMEEQAEERVEPTSQPRSPILSSIHIRSRR